MINLIKDGVTMSVNSENQVSAFIRAGWEIKGSVEKAEPIPSETVTAEPVKKRTGRPAKNAQ